MIDGTLAAQFNEAFPNALAFYLGSIFGALMGFIFACILSIGKER